MGCQFRLPLPAGESFLGTLIALWFGRWADHAITSTMFYSCCTALLGLGSGFPSLPSQGDSCLLERLMCSNRVLRYESAQGMYWRVRSAVSSDLPPLSKTLDAAEAEGTSWRPRWLGMKMISILLLLMAMTVILSLSLTLIEALLRARHCAKST